MGKLRATRRLFHQDIQNLGAMMIRVKKSEMRSQTKERHFRDKTKVAKCVECLSLKEKKVKKLQQTRFRLPDRAAAESVGSSSGTNALF